MTALARLLSAALLALAAALPLRAEPVTVFAAASLKTALDEIAARYEAATGDAVTVAHAGSSGLARQIRMGAPADLFISANPGWMDALEAEGLLAPGTRRDLLRNRLVLIAPEGGPPALDPARDDLAAALGTGRLAVALPEAVPAGIYAKAALQHLGRWEGLADRLAPTDNVRAALRLVALGETPLGVVYATDAGVEPQVRVVATFPEESHPPILYPAAILAGRDRPEARRFLDFLAGPEAGALFQGHGFALADPPE